MGSFILKGFDALARATGNLAGYSSFLTQQAVESTTKVSHMMADACRTMAAEIVAAGAQGSRAAQIAVINFYNLARTVSKDVHRELWLANRMRYEAHVELHGLAYVLGSTCQDPGVTTKVLDKDGKLVTVQCFGHPMPLPEGTSVPVGRVKDAKDRGRNTISVYARAPLGALQLLLWGMEHATEVTVDALAESDSPKKFSVRLNLIKAQLVKKQRAKRNAINIFKSKAGYIYLAAHVQKMKKAERDELDLVYTDTSDTTKPEPIQFGTLFKHCEAERKVIGRREKDLETIEDYLNRSMIEPQHEVRHDHPIIKGE